MTSATCRELREYQHEAIDFMLARPAAGLFLDMGLGKTGSVLHVLRTLTRIEEEPALVVGPIRVIETVWRQEAALWPDVDRLTFSLVRGDEDARLTALRAPADVYLVNPEHLRWTLTRFRKCPFSVLVIDESSMFKNPGTERFKTLRWTARHFKYRFVMSGTPSPNSLLDLWAQIFLIDGGDRLGTSHTRFKHRFFTQKSGYVWVPRKGAKQRIYKLIEDVALRLENNLGLPEVMTNQVVVPIPPAAQSAYEEVEAYAFTQLDSGQVTAANAAVVMMKCRQIANGVVYTESEDGSTATEVIHKKKVEATKEILRETGSPVILVYNFRHELELLKKELSDFHPVVMNEHPAEEVTQSWNYGKIPLLLLHPQSGGHGLNLQQGGHTIIWFGLTFSYEQYAQTIARLHRSGQTNPVVNHQLIVPDTVDDVLVQTLNRKAGDQQELFDHLKAYRRKKNGSSRGARRLR